MQGSNVFHYLNPSNLDKRTSRNSFIGKVNNSDVARLSVENARNSDSSQFQ